MLPIAGLTLRWEGATRWNMSPLEFALTLLGISVGAGFLGSLVGLGGGVVVVPALTLLYA